MILNKKGHFTPLSSMLRVIIIVIMLIFLDMSTNNITIDPAVLCLLSSIVIITTLCSFASI